MAGILQSIPLTPMDQLAGALPPLDYQPENWLVLSTFLVMEHQPYVMLPQQLMVDPVDPNLPSLAERFWMVGER